MSFEVYVQCFKNGEPAGGPRDLVRAVFGEFLTETETSYWTLRYDATNSCDIAVDALHDDESLVHHLCVHRPCGDMRLWDALAAILKLGTVVLYFPGDGPPLVAASSVAEHLPADLLEPLGTPACAATGDEILRHIDAA